MIYQPVTMKYGWECRSSLQQTEELFIRHDQAFQCNKCQDFVTVSCPRVSGLPWHFDADEWQLI